MATAAAEPGALDASPPRKSHARTREGEQVAASLRGQLQVAAPNHAELVEDTLVQAMQSRKRATLDCPHCKRRSQVEVLDATAAVNAAKVLLEQAEGRPAVAGELSQSPLIVRRVGQTKS